MGPLPVLGGGHRRYARGDVLALPGEGDAGGDQAAAVYTRARTEKQAEAANLERPRLRLMEYAVRKGYRVVPQVRDVAAGRNAGGAAKRGNPNLRLGLQPDGGFTWSAAISHLSEKTGHRTYQRQGKVRNATPAARHHG